MAAYDLFYLSGTKQKRLPSASSTVDFLAIRIGASNLAITEASGHFDFNAKRLTNLLGPSAGSDAATKDYVDSVAGAGYDPKDSVDLATAAALPASTYDNGTAGVGAFILADANGALTVDGVAVTAGMRILVKNQAAGLQNGVYDVTVPGDGSNPFRLTRSTDFDNSPGGEVTKGARMLVTGGTAATGWSYYLTTATTVTIGTTALAFGLADSTPTGTAASGGGIQGKLSADSDLGLGVTAGVARVKVSGTGIDFAGGNVALKLDGGTLTQGASGAKVADAGITATQLAGSVAGAGLAGGAGTALSVNTGDGTKIVADAVVRDDAETLTNDNAGTISQRQVVYVKSDGDVDLAQANGTYDEGTQFGLVEDATIPTTAGGKITLRAGAKVPGFTGLTIGVPIYLSRSSAGGYAQNLSGFVAGEHVVSLGKVLSATTILFNPRYLFEY